MEGAGFEFGWEPLEMPTPTEDERDFVLPVPNLSTKSCTFYLMRGRNRIADVVFEDAVGADGKAVFEKIVEAYDHFRDLKRSGRIK